MPPPFACVILILTSCGEVAERLKALVSKTSMGLSLIVGSNPTLSAIRAAVRPLSAGGASPDKTPRGEVLEWPNRRDWKSRVACRM